MSLRIRMTPKDRKAEILDAAFRSAKAVGFANLRQADIAALAKCAHGTVSLRWGTMGKLKTAVMSKAVADEHLPIVAAGLALGHPTARKAPADLKDKALKTLSK